MAKKRKTPINKQSRINNAASARKRIAELKQNFEAYITTVQQITEAELEEIAAEIEGRSNLKAPKTKGPNSGSHIIERSFIRNETEGTKARFVIGYDDPTGIATIQHEWKNDPYINPSTPGTEPAFLIKAMQEVIDQDIIGRLRNAIKKGTT